MDRDATAARAHAATDDGLPPALTKTSVLVVDDQANMVRMIRRVLRELGFTDISEAHDGQAALTFLEARPHGLIISDLRMEPMDGLALLRAVRGQEQLASVPFIMLTGVGDRDRIIAAKEAGVSDYVVKPFTILTLKRKLEKLLGSTQQSETPLAEPAPTARTRDNVTIEQELRETGELLHAIFDAAPFAIQVIGPDLKVMMWNAAAERVFGYDARDVIGKSMLLTVPDDFKDSVREGFNEIANGAPARRLLRPVRHRDGRLREAYVSAAPVFLADGRIRAVVVTFEDMTDQFETEAQLRQSQKMEAIGNLTGGLAHDFNNLLAIIVGNLDLAKVMLDPKSDAGELTELVDESLAAALRGAELTQRLLAFARRQPLNPSRLSVNELIASMVKLLERTLGESITIALDLEPHLWPADADAAQLEASIVNLATNARDAMSKGGTLTIASRNRRVDEDSAQAYPGLLPGDYAVIEVSDTGGGMTQAVIAQIFEPFFTTKDAGKGTGLGLSMVFGFMKQSGGHINVYSEVGIGTTFRLYLPRTLNLEADAVSSPLDSAIGAGETILAVEDNEGLRRVVVRQLRDLGYRVFEAETAAAALSFLEKDKADLVFTDIVMPGEVDGFMLARTILQKYPAIKVVLTSGFPDTKLNGALGALVDQVRLLSKPYRKDELAHLLREALER